MSQPSVTQYFNTRKRSAVDDNKLNRAKKVLVLDSDTCPTLNNNCMKKAEQPDVIYQPSNAWKDTSRQNKIANAVSLSTKKVVRKVQVPKQKKAKNEGNLDIKQLITKMGEQERCVTPENPPPKQKNEELEEIKKKINKSSRLSELKASLSRFKALDKNLKQAEKKTATLTSESPKLKTFNSIEFEVLLSPQKLKSPEKPYLSPRKESSVRRRLLESPVKRAVATIPSSPSKYLEITTARAGLKLPYKYRALAEIFRAIDTVSQILHNRRELITFNKLKPAVEEMLKRNLYEKNIAQIKYIYPEAFNYCQKKIKQLTLAGNREEWQLVLTPNIDGHENLTPEVLLNRRRKLFSSLIDRIKVYHEEFLLSLDPPMHIPKEKITAWHPEFDLEKIPDIELSDIPQAPVEETFTSGKDVLERARQMFNCNTRMEQALTRLKEAREQKREEGAEQTTSEQPTSVLKGIPKALLEKVRERQAAKALMSMTRSADKEKELQMYLRLPEIARLTRSLFVTEKKGVLALDVVLEKLANSYRCTLSKAEMEEHLKVISKEVPGWLVLHNIRNSVFVKLAKDADLGLVVKQLEKVSKEKSET